VSPQDQVTAAFTESRDDVYRYLLIVGLPPQEAQEATQEAFLRLHSAIRKGDQIQNMRGWVFRVAHNLALKSLARGRSWQPLNPDLEQTLGDGTATPEAVLLHKERMLQLQSALRNLSPQQRQCLHLRAEGLRYHEIAEAIGIGVSTVGEFLSRAMAKLRKAVQ
jgi:RNA polymerase sigma-70 factor (ECF subfamily)